MSEARAPPAGFGIKTGQVAETLQVRQTGRADGLNFFKHAAQWARAAHKACQAARIAGGPSGRVNNAGELDQQLEPGRQLFDLALHIVQMMLRAIGRETGVG